MAMLYQSEADLEVDLELVNRPSVPTRLNGVSVSLKLLD